MRGNHTESPRIPEDQAWTVDLVLLESRMDNERAISSTSPQRFAIQFVFMLVMFLLIPNLVQGHLPLASELVGRKGIIRLIIAVVGAAITTGSTYFLMRRIVTESLHTRAARIASDWRKLTGSRRWIVTLKTGFTITAMVGVPIGLLMAFLLPATDLPSGGRTIVLPLFVALTALWAVPVAFAFRWFLVRSMRQIMRHPSVALLLVVALLQGCTSSRDAAQANATKPPTPDPEYVAIAMPNSPPNSGINGTVCPGALREAHGTRDYTLAHAEVRRSPIQPADSGHIIFAEAEYVPASAKPADPKAADTLRINCLSMRHISAP